MRPVTLTMSAFGPYSNKETVDFTELRDRNLFLITGPTGAGKTTIFDALSFALFGKASGELRSEESLRSHFAPVGLTTEVALTFELKGMTYHITRRPRQERPKKRGDGLVSEAAKATLIIEDGDPRTVIEGVTSVTEKIEEILGIDERQFKQIMMIPQGEFRKMLVADSKDREKVLRQLFDTNIYRQIQNDLDDQAKKLYKDIKTEKDLIRGMVSGLKAGENESLQSLIEDEFSSTEQILDTVTEQIKSDRKTKKDLTAAVEAIDLKIGEQIRLKKEAESVNNNLRQLSETKDKLRDHDAKQDVMAARNRQLSQAEKAAKLMPVEENILTRKATLKGQKDQSESLEETVKQQLITLKTAEEALKKVQSDHFIQKLEGMKKEHLTLTGLIPKVESLSKVSDDYEKAKKTLTISDEKLVKSTEDREKLVKALTANQEAHKSLSDAGVHLTQKKGAYEKVQSKNERLVITRGILIDLQSDEARLTEEMTKLKVQEKISQEKDIEYKKSRITFLQNQAAIIALELEEAMPCPVCGSTDHPAPAVAPDSMVTKEALEILEGQLREEEKKTEKARTDYAAHVSAHDSQLASVVRQVQEILEVPMTSKQSEQSKQLSLDDLLSGLPVEPSAEESKEDSQTNGMSSIDLTGTLPAVEAELVRLGDQLDTLRAEIKQLEKDQERFILLSDSITSQEKHKQELDDLLDRLSKQKNESALQAATFESQLKQIKADVPESLRSKTALMAAIAKLAQAIEADEASVNQAVKQHEKAKEAHIRTNSEHMQLVKTISENEQMLGQLLADFAGRLNVSGFESEEAYAAAKRSEESIQLLKKEQDDYREKHLALKTLIQDLEVKCADQEVVALERFDVLLEALQQKRKQEADELGIVSARITDNSDIKGRIKASNDKIKDKSDRYNVIGELARVSTGSNRSMMTFERFVLARFFEDIIAAANIRLKQMTQNRYELLRSEEVHHKARQSGLELNVIDHFTGKPRHVKTLSGGESFKASLSMALGLSDVVQSYAGGVRLDTMFIDEGFGTLDQESLDSAINCLIDLQKSGRLVGIISHVQELKERVDTRLEVRSGTMGSECGFVVG